MTYRMTRRDAMGAVAAAGLSAASVRVTEAAVRHDDETIIIDPQPKHELSPFLYMQFMEPLGATDGSVEAAWDHSRDRWRPDVVEATRQLGPTMIRWGGIFTDYYRWREGVGPRGKRKPMLNLLWGGIESNQVGTAEFVDFNRQVGSEPLMCVNFESDGRQRYMQSRDGVRTADAQEAAQWVAYCNQRDHAERVSHGFSDPHHIRFWQLGNETSYDRRGFDLETATRKTVEFAEAMRKSDESIQLIGWGDSGWAPQMLERAGEHLQYLAFHHMFNPDDRHDPVLGKLEYRKDPDRTWAQLMSAVEVHERKIRAVRDTLPGNNIPLALTECHFSIPDRDRCDVLSSWACGVAYARMLNLHQRHGDVLKIATMADFCGNRWQVNAVMIPTPPGKGKAFLMPVARVMSLYRHHVGNTFINVTSHPSRLDVTASRSGDTFFLHVANTHRTRGVDAKLTVADRRIAKGRAFEIAAQPEFEITRFESRGLDPVRRDVPADGRWTFPPASVTAMELDCPPTDVSPRRDKK